MGHEMMSAGRWTGRLLCTVGIVVLAAGCAGLQGDAGSIYEDGSSAGALSESDLAGSLPRGSSLAQFRSGTLGSEEVGPLDDIEFGYDSFALSPAARERLASNAEWLQANPASRFEIEGHCDSRGTIEYNLALGARRASSVREYLVSLGLPSDRVTTISYGKELPACYAETAACWQQNRRAHFVLLN